LGIAEFAKSTLQSGYSYPKLIEPALSSLGQCLIAYRKQYDGLHLDLIGTIEDVMAAIIKWMPKNVTNEGYMRGVANVVTGVLGRMDDNLVDVVNTRVFDVFAALLKNQKKSTSIVSILLEGFSRWIIYGDNKDYSAFLESEKKVLMMNKF
jgi:hypothetical protein